MTENDSTVTTAAASSSSSSSSAPKKLKLTLKLNSSSSSNTPLEGSTSASTTPISSQVNSSTTASPIKTNTNSPESTVNLLPPPSLPTSGFSDLPSGLGNFKGRGRPKKANEPVKSAYEFPVNSTAAINPNTKSSSSLAVTETSSSTTEKSEYSADLKSFVVSMKTFQSRKWSLKRPLLLETKNLANFELKWPAGLWTTETFELSTSHLSSVNLAASNNPASASVDHLAVFEATCKCGKVFNDRSKYRKHAKIHDKPVVVVEPVSSVNIVDDDKSVKNNNPTPISMPTISLKLKLNTNSNNNSNSNNQT